MAKEIKDFQAFETVKNQDKPVLLDFYAEWCGPCKALLPTVEKLADKYQDEFEVRKINVDTFPQLGQQFGVRSIPALFILKDGEIAQKMIGFQTESALENVFQSYQTVTS